MMDLHKSKLFYFSLPFSRHKRGIMRLFNQILLKSIKYRTGKASSIFKIKPISEETAFPLRYTIGYSVREKVNIANKQSFYNQL